VIGSLLARGLVPDAALRFAIRRLLAARERELLAGGPAAAAARTEAFLARKREGPVALHTEAANAQHYEVPPEFFRRVLGPRMKYSGAFWHPGVRDLAEAETAMLDLSIERAQVADGMRVLDLGCGWGALSFRLLERFPRCEVVGISNSHGQRGWIEAERDRRGLSARLGVLTQDANAFAPPGTFDRVLSVEMFEHLWDHERLMAQVAQALRPEGRLFVHVFAHRDHAYPFLDRGRGDWMARTFFTGGWMPSHESLGEARGPLASEAAWWVDGTHYARTARAWLANLDREREALRPVLEATYGAGSADRRHADWRLFFLACEELFAWRGGTTWGVSHRRFRVS
jgi:cyclopropane-fatty-acyl-phospholipid synthase